MFKNVNERRPSRSLVNGITSAPELGKPDYEKAMKQHDDYIAALNARGQQILSEHIPLIRMDCTAEGDAQPRYGTGYALGDVCELHSTPLGIAMKTQLTGLDIVCENGVEQLYPYFGDEISGIRRLMQKMNV